MLETKLYDLEQYKSQKRQETVAHLGNLAIRAEQLGLNDELTPIYKYLINGESAMPGIELDVKTQMAEYLKDTHFQTFVDFNFTGNDFISKIDKVSMKKMVQNTVDVLNSEIKHDRSLSRELKRAEIEKQEFEKISKWYESAPLGSFLIFESLPIKDDETFAVSRIYQKTNNNELKSCFLSLYNSSIKQFNDFRKEMSPGIKEGSDEFDILDNCYDFYDEKINSLDDFSKSYVGIYDQILHEKDNKKYNYGLEDNGKNKMENGLTRVENQSRLVSIYTDTVKDLAGSEGKVTQKILNTNNDLGIENKLKLGQIINADLARKILKKIISKISCLIDMADNKLLKQLEDSETDKKVVYQTIVHMNTQATSAGIVYTSNGCSEVSRSEPGQNNEGSESDGIAEAFRTKQDRIGTLKIDVCRTENCPSHGLDDENHVKKRTLVGGCSVCMGCQKIYDEDKDPVKIYKATRDKIEWDKYIEKLLENAVSSKSTNKVAA